MHVPKWVRESVIKSAKHYEIAVKHNEKVREWLESNNYFGAFDDYYLDQLIDATEITNNPELFIQFLENDGETEEGDHQSK